MVTKKTKSKNNYYTILRKSKKIKKSLIRVKDHQDGSQKSIHNQRKSIKKNTVFLQPLTNSLVKMSSPAVQEKAVILNTTNAHIVIRG